NVIQRLRHFLTVLCENRSLMAKFRKRFGKLYVPEFLKNFCKKTRVHEMQHRVFRSPHIEINRHPTLECLGPCKFLPIVGISKTKKIPRRTDERVESVYFRSPSLSENFLCSFF